ncbi:MAG: tautomerase family protein [Gammaproteobacteria bacterium]|nr:tautomerase family protein [Gammaproteobacteria bacterium]
MAQVKVYGLKSVLTRRIEPLSNAIHASIMEALQYPKDKKFHRFIGLEPGEFMFPSDRSENYTIIEISMFQGRSVEAKKALIRLLFSNIENQAQIMPGDLEITIYETPKENWGIRGVPGDELSLSYKINV